MTAFDGFIASPHNRFLTAILVTEKYTKSMKMA